MPNLARHFSKRNCLFEIEYKGKIEAHLHKLQEQSRPLIDHGESLIKGGLDGSELKEAETLIGELVRLRSLFTNSLADAEIIWQSLKVNLHNAEISLNGTPAELTAFYEPGLQYFRHASEQIGFNIERFQTSCEAITAVLRGLEICANLSRTRIEEQENKQADVRNYLIAVAGVTLAFAQIFTPDVVRTLMAKFCIDIARDQHLLIFAVQLVPLICAAIIGVAVFRGWPLLYAISRRLKNFLKSIRFGKKKTDASPARE
jgi:hypothetical protein